MAETRSPLTPREHIYAPTSNLKVPREALCESLLWLKGQRTEATKQDDSMRIQGRTWLHSLELCKNKRRLDMNNSEKHRCQDGFSPVSKGNVLTKVTQNAAFKFSFLWLRISNAVHTPTTYQRENCFRKYKDVDFPLGNGGLCETMFILFLNFNGGGVGKRNRNKMLNQIGLVQALSCLISFVFLCLLSDGPRRPQLLYCLTSVFRRLGL